MMKKADMYWRKTFRLTLFLLFVWVIVTFGLTWFARDLNDYVFLGFPLGFYTAAQGALLIYLAIIWYYNQKMRQLDAEYDIEQE